MESQRGLSYSSVMAVHGNVFIFIQLLPTFDQHVLAGKSSSGFVFEQ